MDETHIEHCPVESQCRKKEHRHKVTRRLTYGVFIFVCEHQKCYGFHIMREPEGRKDLFTILYEYMPAEVLNGLIIVYDFGCNFREYTLNREPMLFQNTQVFIDRFHYFNHKCSKLYSLDHHLYP